MLRDKKYPAMKVADIWQTSLGLGESERSFNKVTDVWTKTSDLCSRTKIGYSRTVIGRPKKERPLSLFTCHFRHKFVRRKDCGIKIPTNNFTDLGQNSIRRFLPDKNLTILILI